MYDKSFLSIFTWAYQRFWVVVFFADSSIDYFLTANFAPQTEHLPSAVIFGCCHHVQVSKRLRFIKGLHATLKPKGMYLMPCFSYKNGPAWNHFTRKEIFALFREHFKIEWIRHFSSLESDRITRYFYKVLMEKTKRRETCLPSTTL